FVGPRSLKGQLVHLGAYPGFILPTDESGTPPLVQVDVLALRDPQLLYELDLYEEYNPFDVAASPYRRVRLPLTGSGDRPWVYVYQGPIAGAKRIESGDWCRERGSLSARRRLPKAPRG
ncbi:MAG: gamma-glutamylcyclotransferase family protein, partial [Pseudomonadota bacterium]